MSLFMSRDAAKKAGASIIPIHICRPEDWDEVESSLSDAQRTFAAARGFAGEKGQRVQLPGADGEIERVLFGAGDMAHDELGGVRTGSLSRALKGTHYAIETLPEDWDQTIAAIGWGLGAYKFENYLENKSEFPVLMVDETVDADEVTNLIEAVHLGRDLINIPASDMGPEALEAEARKLAEAYGAKVSSVIGEDLLTKNFPMIHAVGRAAHQPPRLVEFTWGHPSHPHIAIAGKGITFDTGGVNIKSASSARLMKKDMGGAAHALALAKMIMSNDLPLHIHVLIAVAENAVSAGAYRPGDVLTSRSGLTVEIDNTDAEGRLVLGDTLTFAAEQEPELIIDFATLTGAARTALGPTLAPMYTNIETPVENILALGKAHSDPIWQMPLWQPYMSYLKSPIADMKNSGGAFAGSVTAALFLERFVKNLPWLHFDVYGWTPSAMPGHPAGGDIFALRALYHWLKGGGLEQDIRGA